MKDTILGHPKGLVTLFFTEMWERLSYYGMRALLVLFMTDQIVNGGIGMTDAEATAIYGIYTALVYLVALPGGWIADRIIGSQSAILAGGIIIMCGHFVLAIPSLNTFYLGLLLVILGTGLLKPNISAILGELYSPSDDRRDAGFSIFYMGINIGGMLGPIICGALAQNQNYGWHYGFAVAGIGMLFGIIQFWKTRHYLGTAGLPPSNVNIKKTWALISIGLIAILGLLWVSIINIGDINFIRMSEFITYIILFTAFSFFAYILLLGKLTSQERNRVWVIIALFLGASMFWAGFEQAGSSLNLFANRYIKLEFGWITLYSSWFQSINSIFIIIFAPMFAYMWIWLAKKNLNPSTPTKFAIGLLFLALGFFMMVMASTIVANGNQAMPTWLLLTYLFHTFGELALSPVGLSVTTKLAPKRFVGQMMGIWFVASALGNLIAGRVAGEFNVNEITSFPDQYLNIVITSAGAGIILLIISKPLQKLMGNVE